MAVYHSSLKVQSRNHVPNFHDITKDVKEAVKNSGINNGTVTVYSQHTTCSVIIQEDAHDTTIYGTKYILQDLLDVFETISPRCRKEGQYMHPGKKHLDHATGQLGEEASWSLNTDAHLRSCLLGRSESTPVIDGICELGEFGEVYFVDFDTVRERERTVRITVNGE